MWPWWFRGWAELFAAVGAWPTSGLRVRSSRSEGCDCRGRGTGARRSYFSVMTLMRRLPHTTSPSRTSYRAISKEIVIDVEPSRAGIVTCHSLLLDESAKAVQLK